MKTFGIVLIAALVAVASAGTLKKKGHHSVLSSRPAPWYNCKDGNHEPGNYLHPYDCTRFISCDAGLEAIEFDCANCENEPDRCTPVNRLVYNDTVDECLWPEFTECHIDGWTTPTPVDPTTEDNGPEPTTEDNGPKPPVEGGPCDPEDCRNEGDCQSYLRCDKETERWVREECGDGMFWNPDSGAVHGGNCDFYENLSEEVRERYRKDEECLACFWRETGECERDYLYQAPNLTNRNVQTLSCAEGLVFSQAKETCQRCSDVTREDGSRCCETKHK